MKSRKLEKQGERALETLDDVLKRREQVKNRVAQTRAKETEQEKASQRMSDKAYKTASRVKTSRKGQPPLITGVGKNHYMVTSNIKYNITTLLRRPTV